MYSTKEKIMNRVQEHLIEVKALGYEWVAIMLQGSQNYNLGYENSDVDTKAIVLPKFEDFVLNRAPTSFTHVLENNEHVDIKDVRLMFECFKKQNINFVEVLFTDYVIINPKYQELFQPMFDNKEKIARYNNYASVNCMFGMVMEKRKALCHPYPSIEWKIDKWGFDGKQLSHIIRINEFIKRYVAGEDYKLCLLPTIDSRELQMKAKKNEIGYEEAMELAEKYVLETKEIKDEFMKNNPVCVNNEANKLMEGVLINILRKSFSEQLKKV